MSQSVISLPADHEAPPAEPRLVTHFKDSPADAHDVKWENLYQDAYIPWDRGSPSPALIDLLAERQDLLRPGYNESRKSRKALVPGCGKGYDVLLLSAWGYDAYGLDVAESAIAQAKTMTESKLRDNDGNAIEAVYALKDGVQKRGAIKWLRADFFSNDFLEDVSGTKKFDLIYDYTFGCALPPQMRPAWAQRYKELLSPNGRLICLEFPTYKSPSLRGPPWAMPPKVYLGHLQRPGQELPFNNEEGLVEAGLGPVADDGLCRIAHFQPRNGHAAAFDAEGRMTDWIGVWAHESSP